MLPSVSNSLFCIVSGGLRWLKSQTRGGALSQTIKPRESSTPTKGLMGGMGTPQGPAGDGNYYNGDGEKSPK